MDVDAFAKAVEEGQMRYPVFVKPSKGSASIGICQASSLEEVRFLCSRQEGMMIQEYMDGTEYGADVYVDMLTGCVTSIFVKEKLKMRAGETDKSVSVKDERLFAFIKNFVESMGFCGMIEKTRGRKKVPLPRPARETASPAESAVPRQAGGSSFWSGGAEGLRFAAW